MFKIIVIIIGVAYIYKQLILPVLTQNRNNRINHNKFNLLKIQLKENFDFLSNTNFRKSSEDEKMKSIHLEFLDLNQKRKLIIRLSELNQRFTIHLKDKGYFPISIINAFKDINSSFDLDKSTDTKIENLSNRITLISQKLKNNFETIEKYQSFRNLAYYQKILLRIKNKQISNEEIIGGFSWIDSQYRSLLTKQFCELCIKESDIKFAELALILNILFPIFEKRDLLPQLTLIYCTIVEIGKDPRLLFQTYSKNKYNLHKEIFDGYLTANTEKITFKSMGYTLQRSPTIEFKSDYSTE